MHHSIGHSIEPKEPAVWGSQLCKFIIASGLFLSHRTRRNPSMLFREFLLCWLSCVTLEGVMQAAGARVHVCMCMRVLLTIVAIYEPCNNNLHGINAMCEDRGHMLSQLLSDWISDPPNRRKHMPATANLAGEITDSRVSLTYYYYSAKWTRHQTAL